MSLRIIGGTFKNRLLKSPTTSLTKPTMSMVRKSVFDICQMCIEDAYFLDLFACSGAMGIEALSRGAKQATFIEKDRKAMRCLEENINTLSLQEQASLVCADVFSHIKKLQEQKKTYDIVYIDPPYPLVESPDKPLIALLEFLDKSSLLTPSSLVFLEERAPGFFTPSSLTFSRLKHKNTRKFASTLLHQLTFT